MRNDVEKFHVNIGHSLALKFLIRYLFYRKYKLLPLSSKCYNSETRPPQSHVLIFFFNLLHFDSKLHYR